MNDPQRRIARSFLNVDAFNTGRAADFTHTPATPVDARWAGARQKLKDAIRDLGGKAAIQAGGARGQQTGVTLIERTDIEEVMRRGNLVASSIADETHNPGLMERFRMPHGNNDGKLVDKLRGFANAMTELSLVEDFAAHGFTEMPADLLEMADNFERSMGTGGATLGQQTGATNVIPEIIRRGRSAVKTLHAIYHNVYRGNAELLGAWRTACHVEQKGSGSGDEGGGGDGNSGSSGQGDAAPGGGTDSSGTAPTT